MRTAVFVDGYNVFYGLLAGTPYKWLDLAALLAHICKVQEPTSRIESICYFTSSVIPHLASRGIASRHAQDTYIRALKTTRIKVFTGRHRIEPARALRFISRRIPASRQDKVDIWQLEEKETDVNIAISMYRLLAQQQHLQVDQQIQQVVLVSADTDMTPALRAIYEDFTEIRIGVILPHREGNVRGVPGSLQNYSHWMRRTITNAELAACQFPDRLPTHKKPAIKPDYW